MNCNSQCSFWSEREICTKPACWGRGVKYINGVKYDNYCDIFGCMCQVSEKEKKLNEVLNETKRT